MENHRLEDLENKVNVTERKVKLNATAQAYLEKAAKWAKAFAIFLFVLDGLAVLGFFVNVFTKFSLFIFVDMITIIIIFLMAKYLSTFAGSAKKAVETKSNIELEESIAYLCGHYRLFAIIIAVIAVLFVSILQASNIW
ncbi:MAG: hypothetical protein LBI60_04240 [Bacteroidales bacterium]|jgi:hypothetical protein|nr:hypothetical protein [Bacteroidales bacterium]